MVFTPDMTFIVLPIFHAKGPGGEEEEEGRRRRRGGGGGGEEEEEGRRLDSSIQFSSNNFLEVGRRMDISRTSN